MRVALLCCFVFACSTSSIHPPLATGVTGADEDAGGTCNAVDNRAPDLVVALVASAPPVVGAGQTITDGTYFLTKITKYTGDGGASGPGVIHARRTYAFANGATQLKVAAREGANDPDARVNLVTTFSATTMTGSVSCSNNGQETWSPWRYDATQPGIVVAAIDNTDGTTTVLELTLQP